MQNSKLQFKNRNLLKTINELVNRPVRLMEVCGTHTVAISKSGIRSLIPKNLKLLSGPGCPVCVTPQKDIDTIIEIARLPARLAATRARQAKQKDVILATFGDMVRVPGTNSSLEKIRGEGADIRIVYSPLDCIQIAKDNLNRQVVFMGVGFETTSPAIAATILEAKKQNIKNFSIYPAFKLIPPAMKVLVDDKDFPPEADPPQVEKIDGFICPGHVSTIIGSKPYEFLKMPCVIAGFEVLDILEAIVMLLRELRAESSEVRIQYKRSVRPEGNPRALEVLYQVFETCDSEWRGLGNIPDSGLKFRNEFAEFDASKRFTIAGEDIYPRLSSDKGCICGEVLKGKKEPEDCKLFGKVCTPDDPVGACMVSSEGTCAAHYRYK